MTPTCLSCRYFLADGRSTYCRRNPPQMVALPGKDMLGRPGMQMRGCFPPVDPGMWCGEYAEAERPAVPVSRALDAFEAAEAISPAAKPNGRS